MKETSIVVKLFRRLGAFFLSLYSVFLDSRLYKICIGAADGVANHYGKSSLHGALASGAVEEKSKDSVFYRIYGKILDFIFKIGDFVIDKLCRFAGLFTASDALKNTAKGSKTANGFMKLFGWLFTLEGSFGFFVLIMFCVPNSVWNNAIGLGIAFVSVLFVMYAHAKNRDNLKLLPSKTYLSLILFMFCIAVSTVLSNNRGDSVRIFIFFFTSFVLCITVSVFLRSKKSYDYFVGMIFVVVVITSIVGVVQAILKVEADASLTDLTLNQNMPGRVFSTFGNPNNFAQLLVLFMPFCAAFCMNVKGIVKKILLWLLMILPIAALLQTYSRSGWIAFAVSVVMFVVLKNKRLIPLFIILCLAAIPLLPETVLSRIMTIGNLQDSSSSYRIDIWSGALDMLKAWWVTGVGIGPGAFKAIYPPYAYGTTINVAHSHMQFLEVFLETGIIGFICYIWMTVEVIRRACLGTKTKNKAMRNYCIAAASSMTGIIFIGLFEYYWFYPRVMFAFFTVVGLSIAAERSAMELCED